MNELFAAKYDELLTEFNRYVLEYPEFLGRLQSNALIVLLDRRDPRYCAYALEKVGQYQPNDDLPDRPVVYVDVGKLAPAHSRILRPKG